MVRRGEHRETKRDGERWRETKKDEEGRRRREVERGGEAERESLNLCNVGLREGGCKNILLFQISSCWFRFSFYTKPELCNTIRMTVVGCNHILTAHQFSAF
jgi:hypothetical protein